MSQRSNQIILVLFGLIIGILLSIIIHYFSVENWTHHMSTTEPKLQINTSGMQITRLFTGKDGQSHFEKKAFNLNDTPIGKLTDPLFVDSMIFGETGNIKEVSWHNPPNPCFVIMLEGSMEIETGDGTKKVFNSGDILLAEDTTGQGHVTRAVSQGSGRYIMVTLK